MKAKKYKSSKFYIARLGLLNTVCIFQTLFFGQVSASEIDILNKVNIELSQSHLTNDFEISASNLSYLFKALANSDKELLPRKIINSNGNISYIYKLAAYEKKPTLEEMEQLMENPPQYKLEKDFLRSVFIRLRALKVKVIIGRISTGNISALWIPSRKMIKIDSKSLSLGTKAFSILLNHELIHIAQSCSSGAISRKPRMLGANRSLKRIHKETLSSSTYKDHSFEEKLVETEAYANQDDLSFVLLVSTHQV